MEKVRYGRNVTITVDEYDRFFRKKWMKKDNVDYLLSEGYIIFKHKSFVTNKKDSFLLKPRHNESLIHLFYTYDIAEYLERAGVEVKKYVTKKPDLVFNINKKTYAIEIETGSMLTRRKALIERVIYLNENYDEWFFAVVKRKNVKKYKEIGNSVDLRYVSFNF